MNYEKSVYNFLDLGECFLQDPLMEKTQNFIQSFSKTFSERYPHWVGYLAIACGLLFTLVSSLNLCTELCGEAHNYVFFGMRFEIIGLLYFTVIACLHFASNYSPLAAWLETVMVAGGIGCEGMFILIQKYVIGHWCPVCLAIAACIALLGTSLFVIAVNEFSAKKKYIQTQAVMLGFSRGFSYFAAMLAGFMLAFSGVSKPNVHILDNGIDDSLAFGNQASDITIYFATDWFCPACLKAEPKIERIYDKFKGTAKIYFIDKGIHEDSINYTPYNLSFMIYNKDKYFAIREALHDLALRTRHPTDALVEKAASSAGVQYRQLEYSEVDNGIKFFDSVNKGFKINGTPTVVVSDGKKQHYKALVGPSEISERKVQEAINELQQGPRNN